MLVVVDEGDNDNKPLVFVIGHWPTSTAIIIGHRIIDIDIDIDII
jgi:hypothetical protein